MVSEIDQTDENSFVEKLRSFDDTNRLRYYQHLFDQFLTEDAIKTFYSQFHFESVTQKFTIDLSSLTRLFNFQ